MHVGSGKKGKGELGREQASPNLHTLKTTKGKKRKLENDASSSSIGSALPASSQQAPSSPGTCTPSDENFDENFGEVILVFKNQKHWNLFFDCYFFCVTQFVFLPMPCPGF